VGPATRFVTKPTVPYRLPIAVSGLPGGNIVENSYNDLINNLPLMTPMNIDENGSQPAQPTPVWTNVLTDGTPEETMDLLTCSEWTSTSNTEIGEVGRWDLVSSDWTEFGDGFSKCDASDAQDKRHLFCFEQPPILYSCASLSPGDDDNLYQINPATGADAGGTQTITLAGKTVRGCNGLARDPTTGTCWIMINIGSFNPVVPANRILATIDESTGVATQIGIPGLALASIAFDSSGTLFGVTGDGGSPSETLYTLSKADATPTFFQTLGNGSSGETIGFNPIDDLMYHLSGNGTLNNNAIGKIFETINLGDNTVTNIPLSVSSNSDDEATAIVHDTANTFLYGNIAPPEFWSVTTTGQQTFLGDMNHQTKGLAFDCGVEPPPVSIQHFKCYDLVKKKKKTIFETNPIVTLQDQFDAEPIATEVKNPVRFCNPVEKTGVQEPGEIIDETAHLTCYSIDAVDQEPAFEKMSIFVDNQIVQSQQLDLLEPSELCVPSDKNNEAGGFEEIQEKLDHFKCYKLERRKGKNAFPGLPVTVELEDQFDVLAGTGPVRYIVEKPFRFCNPVDKNGEDILDMEGHLTCYKIKKEEKERFQSITVESDNQFKDDQMLTLSQSNTLCIPSQKRLTLTPP